MKTKVIKLTLTQSQYELISRNLDHYIDHLHAKLADKHALDRLDSALDAYRELHRAWRFGATVTA